MSKPEQRFPARLTGVATMGRRAGKPPEQSRKGGDVATGTIRSEPRAMITTWESQRKNALTRESPTWSPGSCAP